MQIIGEANGIDWSAHLVADKTPHGDLGWVSVIGLALGTMTDVDVERASIKAAFLPADPGYRLNLDQLTKVVSSVDRTRADIEMTRRTVRAVKRGFPDFQSDVSYKDFTNAEQRQIAATIYNITCEQQTRPTPIPFIEAALGCSNRKAASLKREAQEKGLIAGEARRGYVNKSTGRANTRGTK